VPSTQLVTSVNGQTGNIVLGKADVGLGNVDNTSDLAKPISNATQTALDGKANTSHTHNASDINAGTLNIARIPTGTTGSTVALGNDSRINNGQTAYDWGDFRDYGLGINPTVTNADLITESRFFSTSDAHAFGYGSGIHLGRYEPSGVRAGQLHIENAGSGSEPVVKVRIHNSSGWGTIRTLWHNGNLRSNAQNDARYLQLTGGTVTGVIKSPAPVADEDLANKAYVDSKSSPFNIIDVTQQFYTDKAINVIAF